jgi:hypothetical protein
VIVKKYYPDFFGRVYLLGMPYALRFVWSWVKPMLAKHAQVGAASAAPHRIAHHPVPTPGATPWTTGRLWSGVPMQAGRHACTDAPTSRVLCE